MWIFNKDEVWKFSYNVLLVEPIFDSEIPKLGITWIIIEKYSKKPMEILEFLFLASAKSQIPTTLRF